MFVLDGRVLLLLGERRIVVEAGEAAEFATMTPHATAALDGPAEVLMLFDRDGRGVHLAASGSDAAALMPDIPAGSPSSNCGQHLAANARTMTLSADALRPLVTGIQEEDANVRSCHAQRGRPRLSRHAGSRPLLQRAQRLVPREELR